MPQTEEEFRAAYLAGYNDHQAERDYDPGNSMPDDVIRAHDLVMKDIPLYAPGVVDGWSPRLLGRVVIDGRRAIIHLAESDPTFEEMLKNGCYIGMTVQIPYEKAIPKEE